MTISTNCRQYHLGVLLIINRLTIHQLHSGGFFFASTSFLKASIFFAMFGTFGMETKKKKQAVRQTFEQKGGGHHLQVVSWMYCQISFFPPRHEWLIRDKTGRNYHKASWYPKTWERWSSWRRRIENGCAKSILRVDTLNFFDRVRFPARLTKCSCVLT